MITTIAEHTVDASLITGGVAIDVGCRGFQFSQAMKDMGCDVYAFDIEQMEAPDGIKFMREAVLDRNGMASYDPNNPDPQATHVIAVGKVPVRCTNINTIYNALAGQQVDVLKLDCEGSEYYILSSEHFSPVPKQISVEFHMHAHPELHNQLYEKCHENLMKHYVPVQHELSDRHGAGLNFWDSLWIRNDLM